MFSTCANPECQKPFDYHQGRLLRFHSDRSGSDLSENCCVRHFWLCADCSRAYVLEYQVGLGVVIRLRSPRNLPQKEVLHPLCCCPETRQKGCRTG
jgi:hypothetical protein